MLRREFIRRMMAGALAAALLRDELLGRAFALPAPEYSTEDVWAEWVTFTITPDLSLLVYERSLPGPLRKPGRA